MNEEREIELEQKITLFDFIGSLFLTLPDEELLGRLRALSWDESDSAGCNEIAAYVASRRDAPGEEVLLELGRDRTRLLRGANNEGMRSAYESMYGAGAANETIGSLNRFYADAGFAIAENVHDAVDQLGVEVAFCALLMKRELEALRQGDDSAADQWREVREHFMAQHLGRWAHEYATDMHAFALTDFYRGVAQLIKEVV